jgi:pimeloyl-ACP methyl ester carboxylesterase
MRRTAIGVVLGGVVVALLGRASGGRGQAPPLHAERSGDVAVAPAVVTDPPRDAAHPARMESPMIESHGSRMNSVFYLAGGGAPHPTVLLLHGYPGFEQNLDLAQAIRRAGWNVLLPRYRGAWGSEGAFSFSHALEDAAAALAFLRDPDRARRYGVDAHRIALVGHSMGGFTAGWTAAHDPDVAGAALISAWNVGGEVSHLPGAKEKEYLAGLDENLAVSLAGCTPAGLLAEARAHVREWDMTGWAAGLQPRPVLFVNSDDGNAPDSQALARALRQAGDRHVTEVHLATDHAYSDHRIALASTVVRWLESL